MTRRSNLTTVVNLLTKRCAVVLVASTVIFGGCRNATNSSLSPMGAVSPLIPMQNGPSLSPIQPTSGVSTFGSPTRVPPPPTGSYNASGGIGNTGWGNSYQQPTSSAPYAPNGFQPSTSSIGNSSINGAMLSSTGMTQGLTNLMPTTGIPATFQSSPLENGPVQQTGWVSNSNSVNQAAVIGPPPSNWNGPVETSASLNTPATQPPSIQPRSVQPRSGGMQIIDLVSATYPPGYVPAQMRPGTTSNVGYQNGNLVTIPSPNAQNGFSGQPFNNQMGQIADRSIGQPNNRNIDRSAFDSPMQADFPSTDPIVNRSGNAFSGSDASSGGTQTASDLQWRRPSPRF